MTDSHKVFGQLGRLRRHIEAELSDHDVERLVRGAAELRQRRRGRRMLGIGLGIGAVGTSVLVLFLILSKQEGLLPTGPTPSAARPPIALGSARPRPAEAREHRVLSFKDSSRAIPLEPDTELSVEVDTPERVHLRLGRGRTRFEVAPRPDRSFSVRAGSVTVSVVGTIFGVEVVADRVGVSVEKGAVEVDWGVGQARLAGGESGWFPPLIVDDRAEVAPSSAGQPNRPSAKPTAAREPESPAPLPSTGARELLAEVDTARAGGESARAVELLRRILRDHPQDPRAPLAAFTLGRLLLNELGRPREAAGAFREVRQHAPTSPLSEDALAREVEAWSRAAEPDRARGLATVYLEQFPNGRHARRVKALAGLE